MKTELNDITKEMAGGETFANAAGKEVVDTLYRNYLAALNQANAMSVNLSNKKTMLSDKQSYISSLKVTGKGSGGYLDSNNTLISIMQYNLLKTEIENIKKEITTLTADLATKKIEISQLASQYDYANKQYNEAIDNENRIASEKAAAEANLSLEREKALAEIELQRKADGYVEKPSETPLPEVIVPEKTSFFSKIDKKWYYIGGAVVAFGLLWYGKKQKWF